jgi:hypothetical protein
LIIPYNKFTKVNDIEAQLYDNNNRQVKRLKRSDIESFSTSSDNNSIDDSYVKIAALTHNQYPYTISFKLEYTTQNMMFYPTWKPYLYHQEGVSVENSVFRVSMPKNQTLRFKEYNLTTKSNIEETPERTLYTWKVSNLVAVEAEPLCPDLQRLLPQVVTAPSAFSVDGYSGNIQTWSDIGRFIATLNQDRDKLPPALITQIRELVKNETDRTQQIRKVYEFMQNTTRYVSIQLGIGGWQTMKAEDVYEKGYGDCKALSNYTTAILKELGIRSFQVLVKAGEAEEDIDTDFPSFQFNHVFVCVPSPKDTIWLECTSQINPFGFLGTFTSDRHVVLITEDGGKLTKTPRYESHDNQQVRVAQIKINENGDGVADVTTRYSGEQYEERASVLHGLNNEEKQRWLQKQIAIPSTEIERFAFKEIKSRLPQLTETLFLSIRNVVSKSGNRIFITPNLFNRNEPISVPEKERKFSFEVPHNYFDEDSLLFELPSNYVVEYLPEPVQIKADYGSYTSTISSVGNTIIYRRLLVVKKGIFPPNLYKEYADFRKKLTKADKNQVVLVKK